MASLNDCFSDSCNAADKMFGQIKKAAKLNPRHPDKPARQNSADALTVPTRRAIEAEGVDAMLNQPLIAAGINEQQNATIGTGRRLQPLFSKKLGWTDEQITIANDDVLCLWREDMDSQRKWIDQEGDQNIAQMQRMVLSQTIAAGECYTLGYWFNDPARPFRTALAIIENDRVRTPTDLSQQEKERTIAGHAKGPAGRTYGFYVHDWHRNDPRNTDSPEKQTLVRRYNEFGREQVIHVKRKMLPSMTRGRSALASALSDLKCLDKYKKTRMEAAIAQLAMAVVVKSNDKNILSQIGGGGMPMDDSMMKKMYALSMKKAYDSQEYLNTNGLEFDGAKFIRLLESEDAEVLTSNQSGINDAQFVKDCLTPVARATGMTMSTLTQNFESSYSSARAELISFYRECEAIGHFIVDEWLKSVYAMWLEDVIESGRLAIPNFPDPTEAWLHFTANRELYCRANFKGPGKDEIDQAKKMAYWRERKNAGVFTLQGFYDSEGVEWRDEVRQQFEEMKFIDRMIESCPLKHIDPIAFIQGKLEAVITEAPSNAVQTEAETND